jgi:PhnB protein
VGVRTPPALPAPIVSIPAVWPWIRPSRREQIATMQSLIPALAVKDVAASLRFYNDVLGFETSFTMPDAGGKLMHASVRRGDVEIMFGRLDLTDAHDQGALGKGVSLYTTVADTEDIDGLFAHARKSGATIVQEPKDQFWGHRDWTVADPDGYRIVVSKIIKQVTEQEMLEAVGAGAPAD